MFDLLDKALARATAEGAAYADVRGVASTGEDLVVRNGRLAGLDASESVGLAVRVLVEGAWGFAATHRQDPAEVERAAERAVAMARAVAAQQRAPVQLAAQDPQVGEWISPRDIDPLDVPLEEKIALLTECDDLLRADKRIVATSCSVSTSTEETWFVSGEGAHWHQETGRTGGGVSATAVEGSECQVRSYPNSFGGNYGQAGWEFVLGLDLPGHCERVREEALALLSAEPCPGGEHDMILMGNQLALQIHESCGHPSEFDRVMGHEIDLAGGSFLTPGKRGRFVYGSDLVNLVADHDRPGGLATQAFDDDGVPAGRWHVVKDGVFQAHFTNREWAEGAGEETSRGANRAEGWESPPIIRIPNLSLEAGEGDLDSLVASTESGLLLDGVKTWSIDQRRLNFQFTCEAAWEIKDGRRGRLFKNPTYQGTTPSFWASCDAICGEDEWTLWGVPNCGKGNPMQVAEMSHGASPARFLGVTFVSVASES